MKGITLTQPWATLVAIGEKENETRPKRAHYRGPLAIHAALGFEGLYGHRADEAIAQVCAREPFRSVLLDAGYGKAAWRPTGDDGRPLVNVDRLPRGAIVAVADLSECVPTTEERRDLRTGRSRSLALHELAFGDYTAGRFAWLLDDVRALADPVTFRGNQTLFNVPDDVAAQVWSATATPDRKDRR